MVKIKILTLFLLIALSAYARRHKVEMLDLAFSPEVLHVHKGDTVEWVNVSGVAHTSTSGKDCTADGIWESGLMLSDQTFIFVFTEKGEFPYYCIPHCPPMIGKIVVENSDAPIPHNDQPHDFFSDTRIINSQSVRMLRPGMLDFRITHRFNDIHRPLGGFHHLYGLDNLRDVRIGFDYGISEKLMAGFGRSKGDEFQFSVQQVREIYDLFLKAEVLTGRKKIPFSLCLFANTAFTSMRSLNIAGSEASIENFSERFSFSGMALFALSPMERLSLQFMPAYVRRNWAAGADEKDLFAAGGAAKFRLSRTFRLVTEYFFVFSDHRRNMANLYFNPLAAGIEIVKGGHVFTINLSNATGIIPNTFIPYSASSWDKGEFRIGFTISRLFPLVKK